MIAPRLHQPVEEVVLHLDGVMQLPPELADEVEAKRTGVGGADVDGAPGEPWEVRIAEGGVGEALKQSARLRARDHEHPVAGGGGLEAHAAVGREELAQRVEVVALEGARRHQVEAVGRLAVHGELRAHPAVLREEVAEPDAADPGPGCGSRRARRATLRPPAPTPRISRRRSCRGGRPARARGGTPPPRARSSSCVGSSTRPWAPPRPARTSWGVPSRRPGRTRPRATSCANGRGPA